MVLLSHGRYGKLQGGGKGTRRATGIGKQVGGAYVGEEGTSIGMHEDRAGVKAGAKGVWANG